LVHAAAISTTLLVVLGFTMILPTFFPNARSKNPLRIMLSFSVLDVGNVSKWCNDLSYMLKTDGIKATVFFTGKVADRYPECVGIFGDDVDLGSQTYNYVNLTSLADYSLQLQEIEKGKHAVDQAGDVYTRVFKAPYSSTDGNIYSLLSRSDIAADFSYAKQYNIFFNNQFLKFNTASYSGSAYPVDFFLALPKTTQPIIITFDNTTPTVRINEFLLKLKQSDVKLVNASEIAGFTLTLRRS
jgi:hypothetical protein